MEKEIKKIGKYEILSVIGKGAMGTIYKGIDPFIQRHVAIKTISAHIASSEQETLKQRFIREAQAAGRLQHINIVGIYEYGEDADQAFIAMEYVEGVTLTDKLQAQVQFRISEVCAIMSKVLSALEYAHSMGVVHRDIKPGNIIITAGGEVKVTDFGIARLESSTMTQIGTVLGTPGYMSPEQLVGEAVDNRSDIFSAGALLYELLTGEKAYSGTTFTSVMYKILNVDPVAPASLCPTVPEAFDEIVSRALAKKPENRYQSAKELADAIVHVAQCQSAVQTIEQQPVPLSKPVGSADSGSSTSRQLDEENKKETRHEPAGNGVGATRIVAPENRRGGRKAAFATSVVILLTILIAGGWIFLQSRPVNEKPVSNPLDRITSKPMGSASEDARSVGRQSAPSESAKYLPGQSLRDCTGCPALVVVPAGSFTIGSPDSEADRQFKEEPQGQIAIAYQLAVGQYEVTVDEYQRFIDETGHDPVGCNIYRDTWVESGDSSWKAPGFTQSGDHPATCIAWNDTQAYLKWLSDKTSQRYRLLSSSEWEYVAREARGSSTYWEESAADACRFANVADSAAEKHYPGWSVYDCDDSFVYTAPVGSFKPNGFLVYDMLGNAFEWVDDCWQKLGDLPPSAGAGVAGVGGECEQRELRGGSWFSMPQFVHTGFRNRLPPDHRSSTLGFRVARVLD